jgi:hypothetical protein
MWQWEQKVTRNDLKTLFDSPAGQNVLLWILKEHHVFNAKLQTEEEISLRNWGMKLLSFVGPKNTKRSVMEFMKIAMMEDEK